MKRILFGLFVLSGFCGLLYQVVWLRMAFAAFGVITPVLSIVVSVFMLGLSLGSYWGGRWIDPLSIRTHTPAIWFYALTEFLIGIGGLTVPSAFAWGQSALLPAGAMDSASYLLFSALILGFSILPWCILMGLTFPFMMAFIRQTRCLGTDSFSFLYLANVIGAMLGTLLTAILLIELVGLGNSLRIAAAVNFVIGAISVLLGAAHTVDRWSPGVTMEPSAKPGVRRTFAVAVLFTTGFLSMAMEVVWTRAFTPVLRTTIYSFASLLAVYLLATWSGSFLYRRRLVRGTVMSTERLLAYLSIVVFLPVLFNDPRLSLPFWIHTGIVLSSIYPFCALLGYLTPKLIDDYAVGVPRAAGRAYAWNILGCILGPLLAAYLLLPYLGVKQALVLLALPLIGFAVAGLRRAWSSPLPAVAVIVLLVALVSGSLLLVTSYEEPRFLGRAEIRRDHVATVIARGEGRRKELYVNGIAMTYMTPITKIMAHLPLLALPREPKSACVICLGMGATLRSLLSWDIEATAVELTPSVRDSFGFFFSDASQLVARSNCRIVVDDGRRFLRRTGRTFDVITIDPPPPAEASGVSLLYSTEFLQLVKSRLATNGVFQHWFMGGEKLTLQAVARSLADSFRYVRVFHSIEDWGFHFLASDSPIVLPTPEEAAARLSPNATRDLVEWTPEWDVRRLMSEVLSREIPLKDVLGRDPSVVITDDRPYNEYFLLRRSVNKLTGRHESAH